jgi:hypothetical protein
MRIEGAAVELDLDPFGQVSNGWIRVAGRLLQNQSIHDLESEKLDVCLDYPGESPSRVDCLLIGELVWGETKERYFILVAVSSKDANVYERHGVARGYSYRSFEEWPEQKTTII